MTNDTLRTIVRIVGAFFAIQGLGWLLAPGRAAESLGMPLLDGIGRSTQVGDFAAFFLVAGLTAWLGAAPGRERLLQVPAALIGGAAITRTLAWALQGAGVAGAFIAIEVAVGLLFLFASNRLAGPGRGDA